ncbi:UNVERIFIED_ORG: dienelactone hydrolase [Pseudomonas parafulva]|uniref:dienelactone hydrolase family protein n=1 Tax=Pseudomonas TaxID=286 RepID=UPI000486D995|nr:MULTISPECIES: dienelactone hydrolase family protein [Pseudomonas]MDP9558417.1 dienelactone hydrolase [Pseudomonas parafulva]AVF56136.1 dienelactone hydrolase family protein [Pseudomonas fulva]MBA1209250.1 dienelactone hydrolase family protein [Pseudomonas fulva]MBA1218732.1 dienelactone hydrolase family protein [Pseudomonas fulva]MBA1223368.1 dienelactone hydrolase family protein [Pseudomonas fulva]
MSKVVVESLIHHLSGKTFESRLAYEPGALGRPGLVMAPNWMGVTEGAERIAKEVAAQGYVVLLVDLYGQTVRPANADEAGAAMMPLKNDRGELRRRMEGALAQLLGQSKAPLSPGKVATFGFCFGGCCALELARAGADLRAAISFHGTLDTPDPEDAKRIKGSVLVLHGASDPLVPKEQLPAFEDEMNAAKVDWQLVSYGGAVHSFTDPDANVPGKTQYDRRTSERAFRAMHNLLAEVFQR